MENGYIDAVNVRYIENLYERCACKVSGHMEEFVVKTVVVRTVPSDPDMHLQLVKVGDDHIVILEWGKAG